MKKFCLSIFTLFMITTTFVAQAQWYCAAKCILYNNGNQVGSSFEQSIGKDIASAYQALYTVCQASYYLNIINQIPTSNYALDPASPRLACMKN